MPTGGEQIGREDAEALLEVRRELGPSYDEALVDSFAERIERAVAGAGGRQLALGIVSMVAAIPISVVLGVTGNYAALLVAWVGIVLVNMAHALQGRPRP